MTVSVAYFKNPFDFKNDRDREIFEVDSGVSIQEWLTNSGFDVRLTQAPIILMLNGRELCEAEFLTVLRDDDVLILSRLPEAIAIPIVAWIAANWVAIALVVSVALLLNQPKPDTPTGAQQKEGSPTYSLSSQGNRARLGNPKPVVYGKARTYPDLSSHSYTEFYGQEYQNLFQIFEVSQGNVVIDESSMRFENTPLDNFIDYEVEIIPPGEQSLLYPSTAVTSSEVSGLTLERILGPYVSSAVGELANQISIDIVAPGGLHTQSKSSGSLKRYVVNYLVQAISIDDNDEEQGAWFVMGSEAISGDNRDPVRVTHTYRVDAGRYKVRVVRVTEKDDSMYVSDTVQWLRMRAYLKDSHAVTTTTRVAIKIRSSEQISSGSVSKFNLVSSRKLPVWHPVDGWQVEQETQNPVWVFCDILRASYGGTLSDSHIDLTGLYALAQQFDEENIAFNGVFDTKGDCWEALIKVSQVAHAMPVDRAGVYHMVRDNYSEYPVQAFCMRNIVKGSFNISMSGVLEETSDAVNVEFFDEDQDYRSSSMLCALPGSEAVNPASVTMFGVTNSKQAHSLGMYMAAQNHYRRKTISFITGIEGRIPFYGDLITVSHYMLGQENVAQVSGDVVNYDGLDQLLLNEDISDYSNPYIILRNQYGEPTEPYRVQLLGDGLVQIVEDFDSSGLKFEAGFERPYFMLGEGVDFKTDVKVTKIEPQGDNKIRITGFVDDVRVYQAADLVDVPPINTLPESPTFIPTVSNLTAALLGEVGEPVVVLSWLGENADYYDIQYSTDGGNTWLQAGTTTNQRFTDSPEAGVIQYRIAAVNIFRGEWVGVVVDTNDVEFSAPPAATQLQLREAFLSNVLKIQWQSAVVKHRVIFKKNNVELYAQTVDDTQFDLSAETALANNLGRAFTVEVFAVGPNGQVADTAPSLSVANPAPAQLNNLSIDSLLGSIKINFDWPSDLDLTGVSVWISTQNNFTPSQANLVIFSSRDPVLSYPLQSNETVYVRVAAIDAWGLEGVNYSGQYSATGSGVDLSELENDLENLADELIDLDSELGGLASELDTVQASVENVASYFPVTATRISTNAITTPKLVAGAVIADKIAANAITASKVAANAISTDKLAANAVSAGKIAANAISTSKLAANSVSAAKIQAAAITADKLAANSVTASKISVGDLSAVSASLGTVTAGTMKTTSGTGQRVEVSSAGTYPLWIGSGTKNAANGIFYVTSTGELVYKGKLQVKSATSGERMEVEEDQIRVYDASGRLRVKLGDLS